MIAPDRFVTLATQGEGLTCPKCGGRELPVLYTRRRKGCIVRFRRCGSCRRRVMTHERVERCVVVRRKRAGDGS